MKKAGIPTYSCKPITGQLLDNTHIIPSFHCQTIPGFDHGIGHSICICVRPKGLKTKGIGEFQDSDYHPKWLKVADAVIMDRRAL